MDYEKKYKEALSRAATELETCGADKSLRNMIYAIFPDELKESNDERIREEILGFIKTNNAWNKEWIAWLEKKPVGKPKLKFKVGDMVCKKKDNSFCATINSITDTVYLCDVFDSDGDYDDDYAFLISEQDEYELVAKKIEDEIEIPFGAKDSELIEERYYIPKGCYIEVRDGYVAIKKCEKPAAWSDEDKEYLAACIDVIDNFYTLSGELKTLTKINVFRREYAEKLKFWLKSLKDRLS